MMTKITKEHMKAYVEANTDLVSVKKQAPGITVLKYKPKVFYRGLWTPELCELRGTVVDDDFNIIQRPFTKIFNYGEKKAPRIKDDEWMCVVEKVNGFMAAATVHKGELFISTTGSIASDFADMAREHIEKLNWDKVFGEYTYIFEICDVRDPHVIKERAGAYLLGTREKTWEAAQHYHHEEELDVIAEELGCNRPTAYDLTFAELKEEARLVKHEGFVGWTWDDQKELKIKSPYYLTVKFFGRKSEERLTKLLENPEETKKLIDEEYYNVIDHLAINKRKFLAMDEQERFAYLRDYFDNELTR